ncbi:MAG: hypothetical protein ACOYNF_03480 [Rhodoferax sp.]
MYTLSIEDTVEVPVKFTLKAGKVNKTYAFNLIGTRRAQDDIEGWVGDKDKKIKEILADVITGWAGQRLVMDGEQPADFNAESFAAMLNVQGVAAQIYVAYLKECGAKEKN